METTPVVLNADFESNLYRGEALSLMRMLKRELFLGKLNTGNLTRTFGDAEISCSSCYGIDTIAIKLRSTKQAIKIKIPVLDWAYSGSIIYGALLTLAQFTVKARDPELGTSVAGTFKYRLFDGTPAIGVLEPAGVTMVSATFSPAKIDEYESVVGSKVVSIVKADQHFVGMFLLRTDDPEFIGTNPPTVERLNLQNPVTSAYLPLRSWVGDRFMVIVAYERLSGDSAADTNYRAVAIPGTSPVEYMYGYRSRHEKLTTPSENPVVISVTGGGVVVDSTGYLVELNNSPSFNYTDVEHDQQLCFSTYPAGLNWCVQAVIQIVSSDTVTVSASIAGDDNWNADSINSDNLVACGSASFVGNCDITAEPVADLLLGGDPTGQCNVVYSGIAESSVKICINAVCDIVCSIGTFIKGQAYLAQASADVTVNANSLTHFKRCFTGVGTAVYNAEAPVCFKYTVPAVVDVVANVAAKPVHKLSITGTLSAVFNAVCATKVKKVVRSLCDCVMSADAVVVIVRHEQVIVPGSFGSHTYPFQVSTSLIPCTANIEGTFTCDTYYPEAGTAYITVIFTPADASYLPPTAVYVPISITKAYPGITFVLPESIVAGVVGALSAYKATSTIEGITFTYHTESPFGPVINMDAAQVKNTGLSIYAVSDATTNYASNAAWDGVIVKGVPVITWGYPTAISYGTPLVGGALGQLNATANVPGTFVYTPPAGTVLPASSGTELQVVFHPTDSINYTTATENTGIVVNKATAPATFSLLSATAQYGTPLAYTITPNLPGQWFIDPPAGSILDVGTHSVTAVYTPADTVNYLQAEFDVVLTVTKATPVCVWNTEARYVDNKTLGAIATAVYVNAITGVVIPGTFVYTLSNTWFGFNGIIADFSRTLFADTFLTMTCQFTPTDTVNYNVPTSDVRNFAIIQRKDPGLVWPPPHQYLTYSVMESVATALTSGTFTYAPVLGTQLERFSAAAVFSVTFIPTNQDEWYPVTLTYTDGVSDGGFVVAIKAPNVVVTSSSIPYGTVLSASTLHAVATVSGNVVTVGHFTYKNTETGEALTIGQVVPVGQYSITAVYHADGDPRYLDSSGIGTLTVNKADPVITWNIPATVLSGYLIPAASANIAGSFLYIPVVGTSMLSGAKTAQCVFTPSDTTNYNVGIKAINFNVLAALSWYYSGGYNEVLNIRGGTGSYTVIQHGVLSNISISALNYSGGAHVTFTNILTLPHCYQDGGYFEVYDNGNTANKVNIPYANWIPYVTASLSGYTPILACVGATLPPVSTTTGEPGHTYIWHSLYFSICPWYRWIIGWEDGYPIADNGAQYEYYAVGMNYCSDYELRAQVGYGGTGFYAQGRMWRLLSMVITGVSSASHSGHDVMTIAGVNATWGTSLTASDFGWPGYSNDMIHVLQVHEYC